MIPVLLLVGIFLYFKLNIARQPWSVVYATNGKIYLGKIVQFPKFQLFDAYTADIVQDPEKPEGQLTLRLTPLSEVSWAPKKAYFNEDQIIFYGPLEESSRAYQAIQKNRE